ncbi:MAG TPA: response regulator transcription factor [Acidobacteriaceae bacterium]|jgi:DNA-binding response OmpR family regulator|nr:response regulator transcription factor [Acidobacteriaceae bacterium]
MHDVICSPLSVPAESGTHSATLSASEKSRRTITRGGTAERRILIVEDDIALADFLSAELESQQFAVELLHDGEEALRALGENQPYDLLILDLNLPRLDGISLIRKMRPEHPRLPLLVLTARSQVEDKVTAFQSGADDCLTKPFSLAELLARIQALLRRNSGLVPNCSQIGDLTLLRDERRVERNGRRIELTPREFAILEVMMRNAGHPVSRATLLREVWNMPAEPSTNIVDVYMKYVRDKVDRPGERRLTHTIRGFGYELRDADA